MRASVWLITVSLALQALPGAAQSTKYKKGEQVPLFANKVHATLFITDSLLENATPTHNT